MQHRFRVLGPLVAVAALLGACGSDDETTTTSPDAPATSSATAGDTAGPDGTDAGQPPTTGGTDGTQPAAPVEGASITIALGAEPTSLDPHAVDDGGERAINDNVYETLLTRNAAGEIQPLLATDLPTQIDDVTWEFRLRDGVTFHDGTPFDAAAVVASIDRVIRLRSEGKMEFGFYDVLAGAEAVDDATVRVTLTGPDGLVAARFTWLKIVAPGTEPLDDLSDSSNGTGPYTFVSAEAGVSIELAANPSYWGGAPSIAGVRYEFVSEAGTRLAGLKSGRFDLITNLAPHDVNQAPNYAAIQAQEHPIVILDADEGITADKDVRLALNLAVDKETIAEAVYGGFAAVDPGQLLSPSIVGFNDELEAYPYDPEEARRLIEEAGVAGETITLVGESSGRWLNDRDLVEALAGYWTEAGLEVNLETPEFGTYLDILFDRESRPDAIFVSSSNDLLDADRQLSAEYHMDGSEASNSNEELAKLIDDARAETDQDARAELYEQAVQLAFDEAYFVFLVNNQDIYGLSERLAFTPRVDSKLIVNEMSVTG